MFPTKHEGLFSTFCMIFAIFLYRKHDCRVCLRNEKMNKEIKVTTCYMRQYIGYLGIHFSFHIQLKIVKKYVLLISR